MERKKYFFTIIKKYMLRLKNKSKVNAYVQGIYDKYGYGYNDVNDAQLLMELQNYNMMQDVPYFATGQSGYFHEQIMNNGLGNFKLNTQDIEDAKYISSCFGKNTTYSENGIPITYTTLLGTTEFNYGTQTFPAGIFEDVFQCSATHELPIQPVVGESEQNFYLRLLEHQIDSSEEFNTINKQEVVNRGKRLIHNFCAHKNKIYLIKLSNIQEIKASFGDIKGLRDGTASFEESQQKIQELPSFSQLLSSFNINSNMIYNDPNMQSEFGIALYGLIPYEKIQFIEVERKYEMMQRRAIELGYSIGDVMPLNLDSEITTSIKR